MKQSWMQRHKYLYWSTVAFLCLMAWAVSTKAATWYWPDNFIMPSRVDSVVEKWRGADNPANANYNRRSWVNSAADTVGDSLPFNTDSNYVMNRDWYWDGGSSPIADPPIFIQLTTLGGATGAGTRAYTITMTAVDTSNGSAAVEDAKFHLLNLATSTVTGPVYTNGVGVITWGVDSGQYELIGKKGGFTFPRDTVTWYSDTADSTEGYSWSVGSVPTGANTCMIFGTVHGLQAEAKEYPKILITFEHEQYNTCDSSITMPFEVVPDSVDYTGYFEVELVKSTCLGDLKYKINVTWNGKDLREHEFTVPDQDTYQLFWSAD